MKEFWGLLQIEWLGKGAFPLRKWPLRCNLKGKREPVIGSGKGKTPDSGRISVAMVWERRESGIIWDLPEGQRTGNLFFPVLSQLNFPTEILLLGHCSNPNLDLGNSINKHFGIFFLIGLWTVHELCFFPQFIRTCRHTVCSLWHAYRQNLTQFWQLWKKIAKVKYSSTVYQRFALMLLKSLKRSYK